MGRRRHEHYLAFQPPQPSARRSRRVGGQHGLPLLDCFLDINGTALASGAPLPVRFGTWFWGCGLNPGRWIPNKVGADYDTPAEIKVLTPFKDRLSVFSGFKAIVDGKPAVVHYTGSMSILTGAAPKDMQSVEAPTIDTFIADTIGSTDPLPLARARRHRQPARQQQPPQLQRDQPVRGQPGRLLHPHLRAGVQGPQRRRLHAGPRGHGPPERAFRRDRAAPSAGRRPGRRRQDAHGSIFPPRSASWSSNWHCSCRSRRRWRRALHPRERLAGARPRRTPRSRS